MDKTELKKILKIEEKQEQIEKITKEMSDPEFWNDQKKASEISQQLSYLNDIVNRFNQAETEKDIEFLQKEALFTQENDSKGAILSIHAGAGGTEAQDWAEMLLRMFTKYSEKNNYKVEILDKSMGEEAGIKSAELRISGINAYGNLKGEAGVHRLVRISPYDADKARHTSFALVEVIPEFDQLNDVQIDEKEIKIDVFRASGHGGQGVNTTDSAVRITHLPSKTVVTVQNERSQLQNKETAMKIIKMKIKKLQLDAQLKKEKDIRGDHVSAEWGNQIRSYVLQPYQQVKDHRTDFTSSNPSAVLEGDLDGFIQAYLKMINN